MVVTPHPYSSLRIDAIGMYLDLDLVHVVPATKADLDGMDKPDLVVAMNNHVVPPIAPVGRINILHCQFPFPMNTAPTNEEREWLSRYDSIVVNSTYTSTHVAAALKNLQLPTVGLDLLYPPVRQFSSCGEKQNHIVSVGRFFIGGHSKRHERLIEAFKRVALFSREPVEFHIVGSTTPEPAHMTYLLDLMKAAEGFPIYFHVNESMEALAALYGSARIYWHGTGLDVDRRETPEAAEHFGISIVEAMSAEAIPLALRWGGPAEVIQHGINGFLYESLDSLVDQTLALLAMSAS